MKKLELYREFLKSKRPIDEIVLKKIEENLKAKYIYNSNGIEGNTLSLMEANLIIEHGITIKGKSLKEHLEVKGQEYALKFLSEVMKQKEEISLRMIREFNGRTGRLLMNLELMKDEFPITIRLFKNR